MQASPWNDNGEDDSVEGKAFGFRHQPQRSLFLLLADGQQRFFSYDDLWGGILTAPDTLMIYFVTGTIILSGKGLSDIHRKIAEERVTYLHQQHVPAFQAASEAHYIERIAFAPPDPQALGQSSAALPADEAAAYPAPKTLRNRATA